MEASLLMQLILFKVYINLCTAENQNLGGLLCSGLDNNMENNCSKEVNITVNAVF